jgi:hypothetical protein
VKQPGVYIASRTRHAPKWRELRDSGYPILSTWIDEAGPGQTTDYSDLMHRCVAEAATAAALIVYAEGDDVLGWKGVWFEMGAACASDVPVFFVGTHDFPSALRHPSVFCCESFEDALALALAKARRAARLAPTTDERRCPQCVAEGATSVVHLDERWAGPGLYFADWWCSNGHNWTERSKPWGNEQRAVLRQLRAALKSEMEHAG